MPKKTIPKGAVRKGAIIGSLAGVAVFIIAGALRLTVPTNASESKPVQVVQLTPAPTINGDCNVQGNSNTITGGINCPKYGPNPPKFEVTGQDVKPRGDGTYDLTITTTLVSQTLVKLLYVSVDGPTVLDFTFMPTMSGAFSNWNGKMNDDGAKALGYYNPPPGLYVIKAHLSKPPVPTDRINLRYNVEHD